MSSTESQLISSGIPIEEFHVKSEGGEYRTPNKKSGLSAACKIGAGVSVFAGVGVAVIVLAAALVQHAGKDISQWATQTFHSVTKSASVHPSEVSSIVIAMASVTVLAIYGCRAKGKACNSRDEPGLHGVLPDGGGDTPGQSGQPPYVV